MPLSLTPVSAGVLTASPLSTTILGLNAVSPGALTLSAAPTAASSSVVCSEGLPDSSGLACGEIGLSSWIPDPVALSLNPVTPS